MDSERGYGYFKEKNQWAFDMDLFMRLTNKAITRDQIEPDSESESDPEDSEDEDFQFNLRTFKNCIYDHSRRNHKWT